jgi:hypothetical protein
MAEETVAAMAEARAGAMAGALEEVREEERAEVGLAAEAMGMEAAG